MRGLIDHGIAGRALLSNNQDTKNLSNEYNVYFGLGQSLNLIHSPEVFKVSLAGIRLGYYLMRSMDSRIMKRSFLDIGTGSGVHALLMCKLGNDNVTAVDISEHSIEQARLHEHINLKKNIISFFTSDLFNGIPERKFQTVVFNPPGWRTPSQELIQELMNIEHAGQMPVRAMFYGEDVITRFLEDLPGYLSPEGKAIVGLNSLVGINDVLNRYTQKHNGCPPLTYRLVERHTFPIMYYSPYWQTISTYLKAEFEHWSNQDLAAFSVDRNGNIYWSYEIVEFFHRAP